MIVLVGESSSGKSTIENQLVKKGFEKIVSYTTRKPREGEKDKYDYHFISDEEFAYKKLTGFFAETAEYRGKQYGTAKEDCTDDKVCVVTPRGLRNLNKNHDLNIISFYIKVPRYDRLIKILQRGDDIEEAYQRNLSDLGQFDGVQDEVNYTLENKGYQHTPETLTELLLFLVEEHGK